MTERGDWQGTRGLETLAGGQGARIVAGKQRCCRREKVQSGLCHTLTRMTRPYTEGGEATCRGVQRTAEQRRAPDAAGRAGPVPGGHREGAGTQDQGLRGRKPRRGRPALSGPSPSRNRTVAATGGALPESRVAGPAPACRRRLIRGRLRRSPPRRLGKPVSSFGF